MRRIMAITVLAIPMFLGFETGSAHAQSCPITIPVPADATACACFATLSHAMRCASGISATQCSNFQQTAFKDGLVTSDGLTWLQANAYCPIVVDIGSGPEIFSICPQGCFASDTQLLTSGTGNSKSGFTTASALGTKMLSASAAPSATLMSMADDASIHGIGLTTRSVDRFVTGPETVPLFVFTLANGSTLRVTQHHPMVLHSGKIIEAAQVKPNEAFVDVNGRRVGINSITRAMTSDDVFNFQTVGDTDLSHVIVAEGVLVGDLKLQNELEFEQTSIQLRR